MNTIKDIFDHVFSGLDISDEEKKTLIGLYTIESYKTMMELLLTLFGQKSEFHEKFSQFSREYISQLDIEQRKNIEETLKEQNNISLSHILNAFLSELPADEQEKLQKNLRQVNLSVSPQS